MYSKIVNSKTGQKVSVTSRLGKNILEKYLNVLTGGSASKGSTLSEKNVTLTSQSGEAFMVTKEVALMSGLVRTFVDERVAYAEEDLEDEEEEGEGATPMSFPLPNVNSTVLAKVIEFCEHHCDVEKMPAEFEASIASVAAPLKSADLLQCEIPQWYVNFVDIAHGTPTEKELFYDLILQANYLDIAPLFNLTCAKMASMMKGKTVHEIRETFEIGECTEESMAEPIANASWLLGLEKGAVEAAELERDRAEEVAAAKRQEDYEQRKRDREDSEDY